MHDYSKITPLLGLRLVYRVGATINSGETSMSRLLAIVHLVLALSLSTTAIALSDQKSAMPSAAPTDILGSYRRLVPLEGGSNFRDLGGYPTKDGKRIKRGLLFRSGAMTSLTTSDQTYLNTLNIQTVMDLRSDEELDLYPNTWAQSAAVRYLHSGYSIMDLFKQSAKSSAAQGQIAAEGYTSILEQLTPQLSQYFNALLKGDVPLVVNCSAGQDRTGVASALLLSTLGVERALIIEDYLLSTDFRQPANEMGNVDLAAHAGNNAFAAMMIKHGQGRPEARANSLLTNKGVSLIELTLDAIDRHYGSVANYMAVVLGVDQTAQAQLRRMYLQ